MADRTGGQAIYNTNDVTAGLARVARDFDNYYSLGYRAPSETRSLPQDRGPVEGEPGTVGASDIARAIATNHWRRRSPMASRRTWCMATRPIPLAFRWKSASRSRTRTAWSPSPSASASRWPRSSSLPRPGRLEGRLSVSTSGSPTKRAATLLVRSCRSSCGFRSSRWTWPSRTRVIRVINATMRAGHHRWWSRCATRSARSGPSSATTSPWPKAEAASWRPGPADLGWRQDPGRSNRSPRRPTPAAPAWW